MTFVWSCDVCGQPIAKDNGYIAADRPRAMERFRIKQKQEQRYWQKAQETDSPFVLISGTDMVENFNELGNLVPWGVWHRSCDPEPHRDDYWFGVERCRTLGSLLQWNHHLHEKNWLEHTDWDLFIWRRLGDIDGQSPHRSKQRSRASSQ